MPESDQVKRRSLMKGLAWAAPTAIVVVQSPAYASSNPATEVSLAGDIGTSDDCQSAVVSYVLGRGAGADEDGSPVLRTVQTAFAIGTNGVTISYSGDSLPSVLDLTATVYLNRAFDLFDNWPDELDVQNYGTEDQDGAWSTMARLADVERNGQTFAVYQAVYSGSFLSDADGVLTAVDAGWSWSSADDVSADDVAKAESPLVFDDDASRQAYLANKGASVFSASIDGALVASDSVDGALADLGGAFWVNRKARIETCTYVGRNGEADIVHPCEGYPGAPDPYPNYDRPVERSSSTVCQSFDTSVGS